LKACVRCDGNLTARLLHAIALGPGDSCLIDNRNTDPLYVLALHLIRQLQRGLRRLLNRNRGEEPFFDSLYDFSGHADLLVDPGT
jgi:hypothetical protein